VLTISVSIWAYWFATLFIVTAGALTAHDIVGVGQCERQLIATVRTVDGPGEQTVGRHQETVIAAAAGGVFDVREKERPSMSPLPAPVIVPGVAGIRRPGYPCAAADQLVDIAQGAANAGSGAAAQTRRSRP